MCMSDSVLFRISLFLYLTLVTMIDDAFSFSLRRPDVRSTEAPLYYRTIILVTSGDAEFPAEKHSASFRRIFDCLLALETGDRR